MDIWNSIRKRKIRKNSIHIINAFEPDNLAPEITKLIDFDKKHKIKYIVN